MHSSGRAVGVVFIELSLVTLFGGCTGYAFKSAEPEKKAQLELTATATKQSFDVGEHVMVKLRLKNTGTKSALVVKSLRLSLAIWVHVDDLERKTEVMKCSPIVPELLPTADDFAVLTPSAQIESQVIISCHGADSSRQYGFDLSKPGAYEARVRYRLTFPKESLKSLAPDVEIITEPVQAPPFRFSLAAVP